MHRRTERYHTVSLLIEHIHALLIDLVEEKTARELKKLLNELVDHSYGHHKAIHGLMKRIEALERRIKTIEHKR